MRVIIAIVSLSAALIFGPAIAFADDDDATTDTGTEAASDLNSALQDAGQSESVFLPTSPGGAEITNITNENEQSQQEDQ